MSRRWRLDKSRRGGTSRWNSLRWAWRPKSK
jgi:hypothetical protein